MNNRSHADLIKSCHILFGSDIEVDGDFLRYSLQESGLKHAYRQLAMKTHPDRLADGKENGNGNGRGKLSFPSIREAYEELLDFVRHRNGNGNGNRNGNGRSTHKNTRPLDFDSLFHQGPLPHWRLRFSEFLYYSGRISWNRFIQSINWQRSQRPCLGELLKQRRLLAPETLNKILANRLFGEKLGETAMRLGLLTSTQLQELLSAQCRLQKPIGQYFIEQKLLRPQDLYQVLQDLYRHNNPDGGG